MPQGMSRRALADAGTLDSRAKSTRDRAFVQVPADALIGLWVEAQTGGGKDELPAELATGERRFPSFPNSCLGTCVFETPVSWAEPCAKQSFANQRSQT